MNRLIPACAGKTAGVMGIMLMPWAHPRVCGENPSRISWSMSSRGSSPRVRGKRRNQTEHVLYRGLIPACAGKTPLTHALVCNLRAHPRVCGENRLALRKEINTNGSSPRVRGKPSPSRVFKEIGGLIPACAGKTRP